MIDTLREATNNKTFWRVQFVRRWPTNRGRPGSGRHPLDPYRRDRAVGFLFDKPARGAGRVGRDLNLQSVVKAGGDNPRHALGGRSHSRGHSRMTLANSPAMRRILAPVGLDARVTLSGKFFRAGPEKFWLNGFSYGPFSPNADGEPLPDRPRVFDDFASIRALGGNAVRVYYPPPLWFLDAALECGLRVFIDVPWDKHRCFFEDWEAQRQALHRVRETARALGPHPAVFAISVANEFPPDIVRFYGHARVERFVDRLIAAVKDEAPECLTTCVNFPTTEFLNPASCDFLCFNVYLHDVDKLARYLDRLQHLAGNRPLILGEYGVDSLRCGEAAQAHLIGAHVEHVVRHGLAGSFVFAYTDEWFTGGQEISDWAFGITTRDRAPKLAADALAGAWNATAFDEWPANRSNDWPRVSVVVCSYNGAATLRECLDSLMRLDYPDYEVILVDDGSTDDTPWIAADFPQVVCLRQENRGLSVARNVGASHADGEIVAYTDSDCVADEHWLRYLVLAMQDQHVQAIGGPNITPYSDGMVARCVAASPGNPSHVMLDDHYAEHVPGCNLALRRDVLLSLGGFDPQFRTAGDDVDLCWRLLDAGMNIGYAASAMVWHHRRPTVGAYLRQQRGYGRSEAMVHFKHPRRCGTFGRSSWRGIIYGDGAVGLPLLPPTIYHGRFGLAPYQTIYRHNEFGIWSCTMSLEWHLVACFVLALGTLYWPLLIVSAAMWCTTSAMALHSAAHAPLPHKRPWWARPLVAMLYVLQPIVRGWHRQTHLLRESRLPRMNGDASEIARQQVRRISAHEQDLYFVSDEGRGRQEVLTRLVDEAAGCGWRGDFDDAWSTDDVKLVGDRWHDIRIRTATEELGWPNRFTRVRCMLRPTLFCTASCVAALIWSFAAIVSLQLWALVLAMLSLTALLASRLRSRRRCFSAAATLVVRAGRQAKLRPTSPTGVALDVAIAAPPTCAGPETIAPVLVRERGAGGAPADWESTDSPTERTTAAAR